MLGDRKVKKHFGEKLLKTVKDLGRVSQLEVVYYVSQ